MDRPLTILAFEPFDTGSHQATRKAISAHSRHRWHWLTRPGRAWKWRMRLASLELVEQVGALIRGQTEFNVDAIFATSLLDLGDLKAALPQPLSMKPIAFYLHENQAAYPNRVIPGVAEQDQASWDAQFALTNLTSCAVADLVIFNSRFNRKSFIEGINELLSHSPDQAIGDLVKRIETKSEIVWPPVDVPASLGRSSFDRTLNRPAIVVWPHRWEHDKGPEGLLEVAMKYSEAFDLRWIILGESFRKVPKPLEAMRELLHDRIEHWGYVPDRQAYWSLLQQGDWVLSTAQHEFFGIAVVEAMFAGCLPWLPNRLSYPELLPSPAQNLSPMQPPDDPAEVRRDITRHLEPAQARAAVAKIDDLMDQMIKERARRP